MRKRVPGSWRCFRGMRLAHQCVVPGYRAGKLLMDPHPVVRYPIAVSPCIHTPCHLGCQTTSFVFRVKFQIISTLPQLGTSKLELWGVKR